MSEETSHKWHVNIDECIKYKYIQVEIIRKKMQNLGREMYDLEQDIKRLERQKEKMKEELKWK